MKIPNVFSNRSAAERKSDADKRKADASKRESEWLAYQKSEADLQDWVYKSVVDLQNFEKRAEAAKRLRDFIRESKQNLDGRLCLQLWGLDLTDEGLNQLAPIILGLPRIENVNSITLGANCLREFPAWVTRLPKLDWLNLHNNKIESIPDCIGDMKKLESLNISKNPLHSVHQAIGRCTSLSWLDCRTCEYLSSLPESLADCPNLDNLYLSDCGFNGFPDWIALYPATLSQAAQPRRWSSLELCGNPLKPGGVSPAFAEAFAKNRQVFGSGFNPAILMEFAKTYQPDDKSREGSQAIPTRANGAHGASTSGSGSSAASSAASSPRSVLDIKAAGALKAGNNANIDLEEFLSIILPLHAKYVNQSHIRLSDIAPDVSAHVLPHLHQLKSLDASGLGFTAVPAPILKLKSLTRLDLSRNRFLELPGQITALQGLQALSLEGTPIGNNTAPVFGLTNLRELNLNNTASADSIGPYNVHSSLQFRGEGFLKGVGQLKHLTSLSLAGNRLSKVPEALANALLANLTKLEALNLNHNGIEALPLCLFTAPALKSITVDGNPVRDLPPNLSVNQLARIVGDKKEEIWRISRRVLFQPLIDKWQQEMINQLQRRFLGDEVRSQQAQIAKETVEKVVERVELCFLYEQPFLDLVSLELTAIPSILKHLSWLKTLNLSFNCLDENALVFEGMENLVTLDLSNNRIEQLPQDFGKSLKNLSILRLNDNYLFDEQPISALRSNKPGLHISTENNYFNTVPWEIAIWYSKLETQAQQAAWASLNKKLRDRISTKNICLARHEISAELEILSPQQSTLSFQDWQTFMQTKHSQSFIRWLPYLMASHDAYVSSDVATDVASGSAQGKTDEFKQKLQLASRSSLADQLRALFDLLRGDSTVGGPEDKHQSIQGNLNDLRERCFELAKQGLGSCVDNATLRLNDMHVYLLEYQAKTGHFTEPKILQLGRQMYRLEKLQELMESQIASKDKSYMDAVLEYSKRYGQAQNQTQGTSMIRPPTILDNIGIKLYVQTMLKEELGLPIASQSMEFVGHAKRDITDKQVAAIKDGVLSAEQKNNYADLMNFLARWEPWRAYLMREKGTQIASRLEQLDQTRRQKAEFIDALSEDLGFDQVKAMYKQIEDKYQASLVDVYREHTDTPAVRTYLGIA